MIPQVKIQPAERCALTAQPRLLTCALLLALTVAVFAQKTPSPLRPGAAPRVSGRLIDTDGVRRVTIEYRHGSKSETFTGSIHSTCMLPGPSKSSAGKPLELSAIPPGSLMTVFYVSPAKKRQTAPGNVILAVRFDRVPRGSELPQGVPVPCFKADGQAGQ